MTNEQPCAFDLVWTTPEGDERRFRVPCLDLDNQVCMRLWERVPHDTENSIDLIAQWQQCAPILRRHKRGMRAHLRRPRGRLEARLRR